MKDDFLKLTASDSPAAVIICAALVLIVLNMRSRGRTSVCRRNRSSQNEAKFATDASELYILSATRSYLVDDDIHGNYRANQY